MDPTTDLDDPGCLGRHRETMHAPWRGDPAWRCSLDGLWRFHLADRPAAAPAGSTDVDFDDRTWADLPVPANWELHGHGEAIYANIAYPFHPDPPHPPADNPTGCYRTAFAIPANWAGRRIFLRFGSVDAACHVWVNGRQVGFSTDSKLPAEFDITAYVQPGANLLAVHAYRWSASAYLEKQDYWHLSGIQRSVELFAKPVVHLRDWCIRTRFDAAYRDATVELRAWMSRPPGASALRPGSGSIAYPACDGWRIAAQVLEADGTPVTQPQSAPVADRSPMYGDTTAEACSARFAISVPAPRRWTPETPELYLIELRLLAPDGGEVDRERVRFGFRQVEIVDGVVRLNGRRLVVRGVNRHEFDPRRGRAVTEADMRADIVAMKRLNINAVRTCHYPDDDRWYDLCDELGLAVVDEANLETHGLECLASKDPAWAGAYLERAVRMVLRDRNHPSVLFWSLGNESGCGPHHAAMAAWIRHADPTRPVQYESGFPPPSVSDLLAPMYPRLDWVRNLLSDPGERRPLIMCEYAYAKGNSSGNLAEFWDLVWACPRFQGGFVWDWRDKALAVDLPGGGTRWRHGDRRHEAAHTERMCLNGLVGPDLEPHPGAYELKQAQAPVQAVGCDPATGLVRLRNRHQFRDLSHLDAHWQVIEDGRPIAHGHAPLPPLPPDTEGELVVPLPAEAPRGERFLDLSFRLRDACAWAPAGHEIAAAQFLVGQAPAALPAAPPAGALRLERRAATTVAVHGSGFTACFDGGLSEFAIDGRTLLALPTALCLHRAPTDIDWATGDQGHATHWQRAGLDRLTASTRLVTAEHLGDGQVLLRFAQELTAAGTATRIVRDSTWLIDAAGGITLHEAVHAQAEVETLPRIGVVCSLAGACTRVRWYGRGPHENYPDRRDSARIGCHAARVPDLVTPYIFPQECGLRCDVLWAEITAEDGFGLRIAGEPWFAFSALPVRREDLAACGNLADLVHRDETALHLDGFHAGLGGDTGWTRNIHPAYLLPPGRYAWSVRLAPLRPGSRP